MLSKKAHSLTFFEEPRMVPLDCAKENVGSEKQKVNAIFIVYFLLVSQYSQSKFLVLL